MAQSSSKNQQSNQPGQKPAEKPPATSTSLKDWSEIFKNLVSTLAVIIAGAWAYYQWDTLFPKTRADIQTAAAAIRTDVSGTFSVKLGMGGDGGSEPDAFTGPTDADTELGATTYCEQHPEATLLQTTPIFGQLKLKSASDIPVFSRVKQIALSTTAITAGTLRVDPSAKPSMTSVAVDAAQTIDDDKMFFGGLRENRVEKGQEISISLMFEAKVPVKCSAIERLMLVQADVELTAIDPTTDKHVGNPVRKVFVSACQISPRTAAACNIEEVEALGQ